MSNQTRGSRIPKDDIRKSRRKYNGATRRLNTAQSKLKQIEDELIKKSITTTRRKTLQAQRIQWLTKYDAANVDLQLYKQRVNHNLDVNKKIDAGNRIDMRKEGRIRLRVGKLSFQMQSYFKNNPLSAQISKSISSAVKAEDYDALNAVLADQLKSSTTFKYKLPETTDDARKPLLIVMMNWFKSRLDSEKENSSDVATVTA